MCGIVGVYDTESRTAPDPSGLQRMMGVIRHRGPDEAGIYLDDRIGLGHLRLSIIDLASGSQPIHNEDETLWIVYNGEVFNYIELRDALEQKGHDFYTTSDTEVIVHLYEEYGAECLNHLNGQFAFAIWDAERQSLFLARDRLGIRPLHYTLCNQRLLFASEIKSILAAPEVSRRLDPVALDQIFTFWTTLSPRTAFEGIHELPPGHYLTCRQGRVEVKRYWSVPLVAPGDQLGTSIEELSEQIHDTLLDAVRIRLRADVPVGSYLSGGLDSSAVTSLIVNHFNNRVRTFGITFEERGFDEADYQNEMVRFLQCCHSEVQATNEGIGTHFPRAVWHCEKPLLRTAPLPMFHLSGLVRDHGFKVVLSGEGADEVFGGYNIFREAKIRRFWARKPQSRRRAGLIEELYPYIFDDPRRKRAARSFFARGLEQVDAPLYSHQLRWENTSRLKQFFSEPMRQATAGYNPYEEVASSLPDSFDRADRFGRAQYLEMTIFLSNYLLSSQGDRMAMANSIETRLPYLDFRLVELMAQVPARWKILGLNEKHILKRVFRGRLPERIVGRAKHPYRAPIRQALLGHAARDCTDQMLSEGAIQAAGIFDAERVTKFVRRCHQAAHFSEVDNMALVGILSSQLVHHQFVEDFPARTSDALCEIDLLIDRRSSRSQGRKAAC